MTIIPKIMTIIPTNLFTNLHLSAFVSFVESKNKNQGQIKLVV